MVFYITILLIFLGTLNFHYVKLNKGAVTKMGVDKSIIRFLTINYVVEFFDDLYPHDISENLDLSRYDGAAEIKVEIVSGILEMLNIPETFNEGEVEQCKTLGDILDILYQITNIE